VLAWRYPMQDQEIQNGGVLVVRESQVAVFVNEGQIADVFGPGTHKLTTQTLPLLTNLKNWDKLFESPFKSDVYFFSTRVQTAANGARRSRSPSATRISTWCACAPSACIPTA
jgi:membrane protease subunit (stomatin/prohibitin family)